ncbi:MAG: uncharacterized protein JWN38_1115 [Candidatus Saccharibacteria bacterium]|nr:uncharacterized protein [Candidatus Saccharibacteria bacterium]
MIWSRPENRAHAGKLLVIGGSAQGFAKPAQAYEAARKAGAGTVHAVLPDVLRSMLPRGFMEADFLPSTPSGSLAREALGGLLNESDWADAVLLAGDLSRNSETAILLESFATKYTAALTLTCDAVDYALSAPRIALGRDNTLLVLSFAQLQKLGQAAQATTAFTYAMDFLHLIEALHSFSAEHHLTLITKRDNTIFVAVDGQVTTTQLAEEQQIWRLTTAAAASVWWLQNPSKPLEALTTALVA